MQEGSVAAEPELPSDLSVWDDLEPKLARARRSKLRKSIWINGGAGVIAAAVVVAAIVRMTNPTTISAADVLERARRAEAAESGLAVKPVVVHQRLRVRRTGPARGESESVVWDLWRASNTARTRQQSSQSNASIVEDLQTVFRQNGIDPDRPLSAEGFADWRRSRTFGREQVDAAGRETVVIRTEPVPDRDRSILSAALTVRSEDWRPVTEEVTVQTGDGQVRYEIDQLDHHVLASASIPPDFFDPPPAFIVRTAPAPLPVVILEPAPQPEPLVAPAEPVESFAATMEKQLSGHRAGLCADPAVHDDVARQIVGRLNLAEPETLSLISLVKAIGDDAGALRRHAVLFSEAPDSISPGLELRFRQILEEHIAAMRSNLAQVSVLLGVASEPVTAEPLEKHEPEEILHFVDRVEGLRSRAAAGELSRDQIAATSAELSRGPISTQ
jgi:hypothetical protein